MYLYRTIYKTIEFEKRNVGVFCNRATIQNIRQNQQYNGTTKVQNWIQKLVRVTYIKDAEAGKKKRKTRISLYKWTSRAKPPVCQI